MATKKQRQVQYLPLDKLKPDERNPKSHDINTIDMSMQRFGVLDPIVVDGRTNKIVSGHGRFKTLQQMFENQEAAPEGVEVRDDGSWTVPVYTGWESQNDAEASAALIALNRTTELGGWVDEELLELLGELAEEDDGLDGVGFYPDDIERLAESLQDIEDEYGEGRTAQNPEFDDGEVDLGEYDHECPRCGFQY